MVTKIDTQSAEKLQSNEAKVEIVRMSRGRRMNESDFKKLSGRDQVRVLRNRRNALKTRHRRQERLKELDRENSMLEASIKLKKQQVELLLLLQGGKLTNADDAVAPMTFKVQESRHADSWAGGDKE